MSDDEDAKNVEEHDFESLERDFQQVRLPRRARAGILGSCIWVPQLSSVPCGGQIKPALLPRPVPPSLTRSSPPPAPPPQIPSSQVLTEIAGDASLDKFRAEYEKLHAALVSSHDNERRLVTKCRALNSEIVTNAAKVQTAFKLSEEDQATIAGLKSEIDEAWKMVNATKERERRALENIKDLKRENADLGRQVNEGAGSASAEQDARVAELEEQRNALVEQRDAQVNQIVQLRDEVSGIGDKLRAAEAEKIRLEAELGTLRDVAVGKKNEAERESRKKERMEKEIKELKETLESRAHEIQNKAQSLKDGEEAVAKLEAMLKDQREATQRAQKEHNKADERVTKLERDLREQQRLNASLNAANNTAQTELKQRENEAASARAEAERVAKVKESTLNKLRAAEKERTDAEKARDELNKTIAKLELEVEVQRKHAEAERKKQHELMRERDVLTKLKGQAENATAQQAGLVKVNENTKKTLEQEIQGYKMEAQKQAKTIYGLEAEREKLGSEANTMNAKYLEALEQVKLKELSIVDLQKQIADGEAKLKMQQNLYEGVRADRNLYSKNLVETQDEIQEMRRKFKMMNHQIEQLKEEIGAKDLALVKEHFDHMKVEKEKESLRFELNKASRQIKEAENAINSQKAEVSTLTHVISDADAEQSRQRKEYDVVVNDRDVLGAQLIKRNDELGLLYEKIKIQQSILNQGQTQYRDKVNELRVLKIKLGDVKRELGALKTSVGNIDVLKREVHHLGRELLQERTKVKALSEELENPLNVHRWRKLEGADPSAYEMIQKIQTLQRRLISKTEEVVEKDLLIGEKEKLYAQLKAILARQPGPEVAEQVSVYQQSLREKTRQLKAMASELNVYQAKTAEYQYEVERLRREGVELKTRYYDQKRRERAERKRAEEDGAPEVKTKAHAPSQARFAGGGFGLTNY